MAFLFSYEMADLNGMTHMRQVTIILDKLKLIGAFVMDNLFLSDKQAALRFGVGRCTIWRWYSQGNFPFPVKLSPGCTRWRLSDLEKWETEKAGSE